MNPLRIMIAVLSARHDVPPKKVGPLGATYYLPTTADPAEIERIHARNTPIELRTTLLAELARDPSPRLRYKLEYTHRLYHSYKPGIDGSDLNLVLERAPIERRAVFEVGSGPGYLARRGAVGIAVDIADHPALADHNITFVGGDFSDPATLAACQSHLTSAPRLVVLSYMLDRVRDQVKTIQHFATLLRDGRSDDVVGIITVCLPSVPASPGSLTVSYGGGEWITRGIDPLEDYRLIVEACQREGLALSGGFLTTHYGTSLVDGYEELPCYVMVFRP